jgi:site-specific recombinase XerD
MSNRPRQTAIERDFEQHMKAKGLAALTVRHNMADVRRFLQHIGEARLERITEEATRKYFAGIKSPKSRQVRASVIQQFLTFSAKSLPTVIDKRGSTAGAAAPKSAKEIALRQQWSLDKLIEQKRRDDDLIAKLAGKLVQHYLYFQRRMKGEPENFDDVFRFAAECRELIENNLPLFMQLSAGGRNIHSTIDERVQPIL